MTATTLSWVREVLETEGLLKVEKQFIVLLDPQGLEQRGGL